ncbi:hypothetical protein [Lentzea sp.]
MLCPAGKANTPAHFELITEQPSPHLDIRQRQRLGGILNGYHYAA